MASKKTTKAVSEIQRALGVIEGVSIGINDAAGDMLRNAVEWIDDAVKELIEYAR